MIGVPHEEEYRSHHIRIVSGIRCFVDGLLIHDEGSEEEFDDDDGEVFSAEEVLQEAKRVIDRIEESK